MLVDVGLDGKKVVTVSIAAKILGWFAVLKKTKLFFLQLQFNNNVNDWKNNTKAIIWKTTTKVSTLLISLCLCSQHSAQLVTHQSIDEVVKQDKSIFCNSHGDFSRREAAEDIKPAVLFSNR